MLRECGFSEVRVTKKSGDGGIDGTGKLCIQGIFSFNVAFQCKRYKGKVGAEEIRNFRGSLEQNIEKGVLITTGSFTPDAKEEASKPGRPSALHEGSRVREEGLQQMWDSRLLCGRPQQSGLHSRHTHQGTGSGSEIAVMRAEKAVPECRHQRPPRLGQRQGVSLLQCQCAEQSGRADVIVSAFLSRIFHPGCQRRHSGCFLVQKTREPPLFLRKPRKCYK